VANNLVKAITMRDAKEIIGNPALTNNYLVEIPQLSTNMVDNNNSKLANHITEYGRLTNKQFTSRKLGLLCSDASLPTSSYATAEVKGNFVGVTQEFAHTRLYADTDFTFYVDKNYDSIKFFEAWMDYISGAGRPQSTDKGYFRRMAYPDYYKVSEMKIYKFERNIVGTILEYKFINAFPKSMTAIPVAYGAADLLKVTVSFNYDRYIMNSSVNTSLTPEQQKELNAGLISDRIQSEQNKPGFNGPGSFIRDPKTGKVISVSQ
jgi:hypothetical protein